MVEEEDIQKRIQRLLEPRGTAARIAKRSDNSLNTSTMSSWVKRGSLPNVKQGYEFCSALGISLEYLVTGQDYSHLSEIEKEILDIIRSQDEEMKAQLLGVIRNYVDNYGHPKGGTGSGTQAV